MIYLIPNLDPDSLLTHCFLVLEKVFSSVDNAPMLASPALSRHYAIPPVGIVVVAPFSVAEYLRLSIPVVFQHTFVAFLIYIQVAHSILSSAGDNTLDYLPSTVALQRAS